MGSGGWTIISVMGAIIGWFLVRIVNKNDALHEKTDRRCDKIDYNMKHNHEELMDRIEKIERTTIDKKARTKLQLLEDSINEDREKWDKKFEDLKEETYGTVVWIKDKIQERRKK